MKYTVILEQGESSYGAFVPDLPGCIAAGETKEETLRLIKEAIGFHIEGLKEDGIPVPEPHCFSAIVDVNAA
jgi:predicted RNase H-like HicB family nuclease